MGTLIRSIAFQNFYNYFGNYADNIYTFKEGMNIINADNNMGKSKFYNGFLWILNDTVYDSDEKKLYPASQSFEKMMSGKVKRECSECEMGVQIVFENDDVIYTVKRFARCQKEEDEWKFIPGLDVFKSEDNEDMPVYDVDEKQVILHRLVPAEMEKYSMLQGESMERLVDLSTLDGLAKTINALADINNLIEMCSLASRMAKLADDEKKAVEKRHTAAGSEMAKKQQERDNLTKWIEEYEEKVSLARTELVTAESTKKQYESEYFNSKKRIQLRTEYELEESKLTALRKQKDELELSVTSRLFDDNCPWLLMELQQEISNFDEMRINFISSKRDAEIVKNPEILLPEGSPDTPSLLRMLRNHRCEICDRPFEKDSDAYKHVDMLIHRPRKAMHQSQDSLSQFYGDLQNNVGSYARTIPSIADEFDAFLDKVDELDEQISEQEKVVELKYSELSLVGTEDISATDDATTLNKYTQAVQKIKSLNEDISNWNGKIQLWTTQRDKIQSDLNKKQDNTEVQEVTRFCEFMNNVAKLYAATKDRIFNRIVDNLQVEANKMYDQLTAHNQTYGGKLVFNKQEDGSVKVSVVSGITGEPITGNGTGFQRMKQLAIVMSIISSKIGDHRFDYPFISDAPFSEFSPNLINNFFDIAPNVFRQSIIMIKDLCDPNSPTLISPSGEAILKRMQDGELKGTFYVNYSENRADASDMETKRKCYFE